MEAVAKYQLFHKLLKARLDNAFDVLCNNLAEHQGLGSFKGLSDAHRDAVLDCAARMCVQFDQTSDLKHRHGKSAEPIFDIVADLHETARQIAEVENALNAARGSVLMDAMLDA